MRAYWLRQDSNQDLWTELKKGLVSPHTTPTPPITPTPPTTHTTHTTKTSHTTYTTLTTHTTKTTHTTQPKATFILFWQAFILLDFFFTFLSILRSRVVIVLNFPFQTLERKKWSRHRRFPDSDHFSSLLRKKSASILN